MKSERRHELEKNVLADWLVAKVQTLKPYLNALLLAIVAAAVVVVVVRWLSASSAEASAKAWTAYFAAIDQGMQPGDFEKVAEEHPGSDAAIWASLTAADMYLGVGCELLFTNKESGRQELRKAVERYMGVAEAARERPLRERAAFGLARAREAQVDLDKAIEAYQQVAREWPDGAFAAVARQRAESLGQKSTREFYDKFVKHEPKPAFSEDGKKPAFDLDSLPDNPAAARPAEMKLEEKAAAPDIQLKGPEGLSADAKKAAAKTESAKPAEPKK